MGEHDNGHNDDHHGHIQLQYQPAMPMNNAKLFVWLFLSTEIMFFAALIGEYIVIRFGAPVGTWPVAARCPRGGMDRGHEHVRADLFQRDDCHCIGNGSCE